MAYCSKYEVVMSAKNISRYLLTTHGYIMKISTSTVGKVTALSVVYINKENVKFHFMHRENIKKFPSNLIRIPGRNP